MWDYDVYVDDIQIANPQTVVASINQIKAKLRQYGQNGWELVAVEDLITSNANLVVMVHYLRRRIG